MKVLLITPSISMTEDTIPLFNSLPLGLGYIAAVLEENDIDVKILDGYVTGLNREKLRKELNTYSPDIVGISVVTPRVKQALDISRIVKERNPENYVVLGGPHITALGEKVINEDDVDIAVLGEGEFTMLDLVKAIENRDDLSRVSGILYKKRDGEVIRTKSRGLVKDLDQLPHPAFHLLPIGKYNPPAAWSKRRKGSYANIITSRGCPNSCSYCDVGLTFGRRYRMHSPEHVVEELKYLYNEFNVRNISFRDSIFILSKKRIKKLCELINERGLDISWECNGWVNYIDEDLLKTMKESGCWQIQYGVESGNQEVLNKASRNTTIEQIREAFRLTKKVGLEVHGYFMVGLPGETKETIEDTIRLAKEINPDLVGFTIATPFPGTEFYKWATENKYLKINDWNSFVYNTAIVETPQLSIKELIEAQERALKSYYLRPGQIFKKIIKMRSLNDLKTNLGYARVLLFSFKDIYRG